MDAPCDDLLARAGLAEDEDGERGLSDLVEHAEQAPHLRCRSDELAEPVGKTDIDTLLVRRLDRDLRLTDGELRPRGDDRFTYPKRSDEGAVRTSEIANEDAFVDGTKLTVNGAHLRVGHADVCAF